MLAALFESLNVLFRCLPFLLVLALSGCVFPTRLADETPFGDEVVGFAELGKTTKKEVEESLGPPGETYANGKWWVFHADRRMTEWFAFMCGPYGPCSGGEFGGDLRQYHLLLKFNEDETVHQVFFLDEKRPCDELGIVCFEKGVLEVRHHASQGTSVAPEHCAVFLYVQESDLPHTAVFVQIDYVDVRIRYMNNGAYYRVDLTPGAHNLSVGADAISLDCDTHEKFYVRIVHDKSYRPSFQVTPIDIGRKQIADRRLSLLQDPASE